MLRPSMRRAPGLTAAALLLALAFCVSTPAGPTPVAWAAEPAKEADPAKAAAADPDFSVQGEYTGEVYVPSGDVSLGVQVIALGGGKFRGVSLLGGLPGAGWDRTPRKGADAETQNGVTTFKSEEYTSTLKGNVLTTMIAGIKICELK